jgi:hypothetical protein
VYAGFTDGCVKTWAVTLVLDDSVATNPVNMVRLSLVQDVQVHAGPVTCMAFTGGVLFSASYDFSILPWDVPDKLNAKSTANFSQSYATGLIYHNNCVISMAASKRLLVTGDEGGRVVVTYPATSRPDFSGSGGDQTTLGSKPAFEFSFIEYNFGDCFMDQNGGVSEEEAVLTVRNLSGATATIRTLLKKHPAFRLEYDEVLNRNSGVLPVMLPGKGNRPPKMALQFADLSVARFKIVFHPLEVRQVHMSLEFLINEKELVRVQVRASGCKSKIYLASSKIYDMGTVNLNHYGVERVVVINREDRPLQVTCIDECQDVLEGDDKQRIVITHNMVQKYLTIIPRCFFIPPNDQVELLVRFSPPERVNTFTMPLRAYVGGGESTLAVVRARAAEPLPGIAEQEVVSPLAITDGQVEGGAGEGEAKAQEAGGEGAVEGDSAVKRKKGAAAAAIAPEEEVLPPGVAELLRRPDGLETNANGEVILPRSFKLFNERQAIKYMFRGLRDLSPTETVCPSDMLVHLLRNVGWSIADSNDVTCMQHLDTGVFIEIPAFAGAEPLCKLDTFVIDFMCDQEDGCSYELWFGDRLLRSGLGAQNDLCSISVSAADLYHELEKVDTSADGGRPKTVKINAVGALTLELMVLTRAHHQKGASKGHHDVKESKAKVKPVVTITGYQPDGRELLYIDHLKVFKGFRLGMMNFPDGLGGDGADDEMQSLEIEPRVVVGGITRVVTFLENDLGTVVEVFEKNGLGVDAEGDAGDANDVADEDADLPPDATVVFAPAVVTINTVAARPGYHPHELGHHDRHKHGTGAQHHVHHHRLVPPATHMTIVDHAAGVLKSDTYKVTEHKVAVTESLKTISGVKTFPLRRPKLDPDADVHRCVRDISLDMIRRSVNGADDGEAADVSIDSEVVPAHSGLHLETQTAANALAAQMGEWVLTRSELPHIVHSYKHGVSMHVALPEDEPHDRGMRLNALLDTIARERNSKKAASKDVRTSMVFGGEWYFIVDKNSLKLVSSSLMASDDSVDITFMSRGFIADFGEPEPRVLSVMDGRYILAENRMKLPKAMRTLTDRLGYVNLRGVKAGFSDAPKYLTSKWYDQVKIDLHKRVMRAMKVMCERERTALNSKASAKAAALIKAYEEKVEAAKAAGKKAEDPRARKEVEDEAAKVMAEAPSIEKFTYKEIFADISKKTSDWYSAKLEEKRKAQQAAGVEMSKKELDDEFRRANAAAGMLSVEALSLYLQTETLFGFDGPLSIVEADLVLDLLERDNEKQVAKLDQFKAWYLLDNEMILREELAPKRLFASMLEEDYRAQEKKAADLSSGGKVIKGKEAKQRIADMHLHEEDPSLKAWENTMKVAGVGNDVDQEVTRRTSLGGALGAMNARRQAKKETVGAQPNGLLLGKYGRVSKARSKHGHHHHHHHHGHGHGKGKAAPLVRAKSISGSSSDGSSSDDESTVRVASKAGSEWQASDEGKEEVKEDVSDDGSGSGSGDSDDEGSYDDGEGEGDFFEGEGDEGLLEGDEEEGEGGEDGEGEESEAVSDGEDLFSDEGEEEEDEEDRDEIPAPAEKNDLEKEYKL